jgi:hypothetical protein
MFTMIYRDTPNPTHPPPSIQIAQSENFDIIQSKRYHILRFIRENQKEGDHAMEAVVRIATGTGTRELGDAELKERHWESIGHRDLLRSIYSGHRRYQVKERHLPHPKTRTEFRGLDAVCYHQGCGYRGELTIKRLHTPESQDDLA